MRFALKANARRISRVQKSAPQLSLFPASGESLEQSSFVVRESKRARRLAIKVHPRGTVEVVVPRRTRSSDVQAFVSANREWIENARRSFAHKFPPEFYKLPTEIRMPGGSLEVVVDYRPVAEDKSVRYRQNGNRLSLSGRTQDEELCRQALRRWLSKKARERLGTLLTDLSLATDLSFNRMHIRAQRTCWGSHSSNGTISLNLCILFLDPSLVRYLMIHELCHGRHMNHSKSFWKLVSRFEPDYKRLDRQLSDSWTVIPGWVGIY